MIIRRARQSDAAVLLSWRNDPLTRANSLQRGTVSEVDHEAWFAAKSLSPETEIWLGEEDGSPIGQVRLDLEPPGVAVVDITVAPDRRGQGVGSRLLELVITHQTLNPGKIRAVVRRENSASEALFMAAGFLRVEETPECLVLERMLRHDPHLD